MLAVDADGRIINDAPERRRVPYRVGEAVERAVRPPRRNRDDDRLGAFQRIFDTGVGVGPVESVGLDAGGAERRDPLVRPYRAARLDRGRSPDQRLRAIAEAKEEDFHLRSLMMKVGFFGPHASETSHFTLERFWRRSPHPEPGANPGQASSAGQRPKFGTDSHPTGRAFARGRPVELVLHAILTVET